MSKNIIRISFQEFKENNFIIPISKMKFEINGKTEFVITDCTKQQAAEIHALFTNTVNVELN